MSILNQLKKEQLFTDSEMEVVNYILTRINRKRFCNSSTFQVQ